MTEHDRTTGGDRPGGSSTSLGVLAASLAMRLTLDDLEWLWLNLKERAEEERRRAAGGELPVFAGCRDIWEPARDVA